jgi:hypothetical protein
MMQRDMRAFDAEHAQALRRIWFWGDVHGQFDHIGRALQSTTKRAGAVPSWLVFLGDVDLEDQPLWQKLRPLREVWPFINFAFIHGNHDADTHEKWIHLHDRGPALLLHGQCSIWTVFLSQDWVAISKVESGHRRASHFCEKSRTP